MDHTLELGVIEGEISALLFLLLLTTIIVTIDDTATIPITETTIIKVLNGFQSNFCVTS